MLRDLECGRAGLRRIQEHAHGIVGAEADAGREPVIDAGAALADLADGAEVARAALAAATGTQRELEAERDRTADLEMMLADMRSRHAPGPAVVAA